ncbi:hypothetical protein RHSIM_Rhsim07G0070400 [Rhododendron simsii]|uniref:Uncharacterized protein n=1 Tax=Rhododendron simsii TaxID=118357 RepID=A0A834GPL4_RHOSS|nr:hypothetical protein RHSIM_Rhsim07G0070400 [Rhododendron simsii]
MTNQEGIRLWLEDLEDLAYDLDDVLDEFATEALRWKVMEEPRASNSKVLALVPTCCTSFNPRNLAYGFRVTSQIDEITIRLQDLLERRMGLGLQSVVVGPSTKAPQRPHTSSLIHEPCLYGRDGDKRALIELLLSDQLSNVNVGVVPIVGMGGVGKTTLAQMVYNDETVKKHFEIKVWVCVSEVFEIEDVTKKILESITSRTCDFKALNQVQEQLKEALVGRKFLIVLDDVWNKNYEGLIQKPAGQKQMEDLGSEYFRELLSSQGDGSMIKELGNLIHLRGTLYISGLENVVDALDAMRANLKDKQGLDMLLMKWSNISDNSRNESVELEVLNMLRPHKKLKELTITGYHGLTFPTWVGNSLFSNMVCLKFQNCEKCIYLPPLGQLTSLTKLHIQGMKTIKNVGLEFYGLGCSNSFPALEFLTFEDMPEWEGWSPYGVKEEAQAFARLIELSIKRCPKLLQKLPSNLPCLRKLDIYECPLLVVAWVPSPTELNEVRNTVHFDSLISLSLTNVSIPNSLRNPEVGDEVVLENETYSHLSSLTSLRIDNVQGLECLPNWFLQGLTGLQELSLVGCKKLTSLSKDEVKQHGLPTLGLRRFVVKCCTQLISFFEEEEEEEGLQQQKQHEEMPYLMTLDYLKIEGCGKLGKLPRGLHNIKYLQELIIHGCSCLVSFPKTGLPSTLRTLDIDYCGALLSLPELTMLKSLEKLMVSMCPSLTYLCCSGNGLPPALKDLCISSCGNLECIIAEEGMKINCPSLESVVIWGCESLKSLPDVMPNNNGGCLRNLSILRVMKCDNMESLPEGWFTATNLREMCIVNCKKLKGLPHHAYNNYTSLEVLRVNSCTAAATGLVSYILKEESYSSYFTKLTSLSLYNVDMEGKPPSKWGLQRLSSLRQLHLVCYGWVSFPPEEDDGTMLLLPPSLIKLSIGYFPSLKTLSCEDIPSLDQLHIGRCPKLTTITELGQLPSLSELSIWNCPNLASFSAEEQRLRLPPSLLYLGINACPMLKQRCEKGKGQYSSLIAHIPQVEIDHRFVFDPSS